MENPAITSTGHLEFELNSSMGGPSKPADLTPSATHNSSEYVTASSSFGTERLLESGPDRPSSINANQVEVLESDSNSSEYEVGDSTDLFTPKLHPTLSSLPYTWL
ncbi:hypothetical protein KC19_4G206600 [Ceratodon purpureus]|uniref:Uncharacterized protein n=1 Tax=Ceratodon purpureus TaxID=3225 RepID=A0A8T0ID87_CERPU|nr:hypothetical protein KC19_4G206600 [Ceratodon purpureus]